jgi:hypothetical protein
MFRALSQEVCCVMAGRPTNVSGFAGNRLGAVRDAKGKSVAAVFSGLASSQKAEVRLIGYMLMTDSTRFGFQGIGQYGLDVSK